MEAGKLDNLNELIDGATVLHANGELGVVVGNPWTSVTLGDTSDICEARVEISYGKTNGATYHTYRHDGRSHCEAGYDIVSITPKCESALIKDHPLKGEIIAKIKSGDIAFS